MVYNIKTEMYLRNYDNYIFLGKIIYAMYINAFLLKTHNHNPVEIMLHKQADRLLICSPAKSAETFWQISSRP